MPSALQTQINAKGTGNVTKVGTPVDNQVGVWTGDGTIEGDTALTFDTATNTLTTEIIVASTAGTPANFKNTTDAVNNFGLILESVRATPANGSEIGLSFKHTNSVSAQEEFARIICYATDTTDNSEDGTLAFVTTTAGSPAVELSLDGSSLYPYTTDGLTLGTSAKQWSDLFLAEGGVINWDNGDMTMTQAGNVLTIAGGDVKLDNLETTGSINLGHASDTTLARVSAGVVSIEGKNILTTDGGTLTGNITLGENTSIDLDPAGSADGKYSGICITGTAGATLAFGDLIYLAVADSRWELTDADAAATAGTPLIGMCVLAAAGDGSATKILLQGTIRADAKFPTLTVGAPAYVGETAGAIQTAIPTGADNVIRVVGRALTADELYFCPSQDHQITVA